MLANLHETPRAIRAQNTRMATPFMIGEFQFCQYTDPKTKCRMTETAS